MTPEALIRAVRQGRVAPAYLFSGPDTLLKLQALEALAATVPAAARDFNVQVFHAFESALAEVLTAARTAPFLATRRVVVLRDVEKARQREERSSSDGGEGRGDLLGEYLANPAPETVLVVTTEDESRAKTLIKRHGERWEVVAFRPPEGAALAAAAAAEARRLGCSIDEAALKALLEATGNDRAQLFNELAKLRAAVGPGGVVDAAAVERYAAGYARFGAREIVDAVGRRDLARALALLGGAQLKEDELLPLLGMIGKRLRVLWYLAAPPQPVPKVFNVGWQLDELRRQAGRFSREEVESGLQALARLDEAVKSTQVAPKLLLERFLLDLLPAR